jgi:hypothetical protein
MDNEIYQIIKDYPDYAVSTHGNLCSIRNKELLSKFSDKGGYFRVGLYKNKKRKMLYVSRLVALAFIDNPENKKFVDHIDRDKTNNNISNLRWVTRCENQQNRDCVENAKHIYITKTNKYHVKIERNNNLREKYFKTEEEAKAWRADILAQYA